MYLKRIEIQGFKSFVDKTVLELDQGITAIVGPNGSGKSNIADAIRWCLGEQSAKTLRGGNMQDVIFAGTQEVKPTGFAQVSLTISNENKIFPIDYNEITVTRRIYRSGESEYMINGSLCRLKDIHELFMDTGLGKDGYSVIGQGKIDEILSVKSEDRRQIFEEAAGISKYKYRKIESQRKLIASEENLIRIKDIINELKMQLEPLSEQSEKAKEYLKLYEQMKKYDINLNLKTIDENKLSLSSLELNFKDLKEDLENKKLKEKRLDEEANRLYEKLKEDDENLKKAIEEKNQKKIEIETIKGDIALISNNIKNREEKIFEFNKEIDSKMEKEKELEKEYASLKEILTEKNHILEKCQEEIEKHTLDLEECENNIENKSENLDEIRFIINKNNQKYSDLKSKIETFDYIEENFEEQKSKLNDDIKKEETSKALLVEKIKTKKEQKENLNNEIILIKDKQKQKILNRDNLVYKIEEEKEKFNKNNAKLDALSSKLSILKDMEREMEGYAKSVKAVIKSNFHKGVRGVITNLIKVPDEYVTAIEVALGASAQNIVVETEYDAKKIIEFLKENNLGRATFLPLSSIKSRVLHDFYKIKNEQGVIGLASMLVNYDKEYENIVISILGRIVITDNIDNAIKLSQKENNAFRIVTLSGESIQAGGAITGGSIVKSGLFTRRKDINKLNENISLINNQIIHCEEKIEKGILKIKNINKEIEDIHNKIQDYESDLIKVSGEITVLNNLINAKIERINALNEEMLRIYNTFNDANTKKEELKNELDKIYNEISKNEEYQIILQNEFKNLMNKKDSLNQIIFDKKMKRNTIFKDTEALELKIGNIKTSIEEGTIFIKYKNEQIKYLLQEIDEFKNQISSKNTQIEIKLEKLNELSNFEQEIIGEKSNKDEKIKNLREEVKSLNSTILSMSNECQRLENKITKIESEIENAINKLWDEYELTYSTAEEYRFDITNIDEVKKQVSLLKNKIKSLGSVNIDSIEEYKNVYERYTFLTKQKEDIEKTKNDLEKIIEDMTEKMKEQFEKEFKVINENFNIVFRELFGGGRAELRLVNPKDILNSGIEIDVQPPGKKLQNLMLLSGGERAFTAIALLFAILKVRPTPFCILDEIEAALDDVNVYRFADYIKNYSKETQFIIVTHRRGTMEAADMLYGVTMQQKGISKLLSMQLS